LRDTAIRLASADAESIGRLSAEVSIGVARDGRWSLTMRTEQSGIRGERTIEGSSCRAVTDAAALTLALMLNPETQPPASAAPAAEHTERPPTMAPRRAARGLALAGAADVGLQVGALPHPGPEFSLGAMLGVGRSSFWLLGSFAPRQTEFVAGDRTRGGRLWMATATALGCWSVTRSEPTFGPCLGAAFNLIEGHGLGVSDARHGAVYWVSPTAGLSVDLPVTSWVAVHAAALGQLPLSRPRTYLEEVGEVSRPGRVEARVLAGVLVRPHWHD
jgi:hypothetical protein